MAKKTSPVNNTIKKKSSNASGGNAQKPAVKTSSKKHASVQVKRTDKPSPKKRSQKTIASKRIPLKQQLAQREAELDIINSIQQGLAAALDFQAIVDLVGDKLREVFNTPNLNITWYDKNANLLHYLYIYERGKRKTVIPQPPRAGGIFETLVATRQSIVMNTVEELTKLNATIPLPGTEASKSSIEVPIISSDRVLGGIGIDNFERENAFGESEARLLTTVSASLGTALENARLFKAEQERVAELQIINSIQQGLASKLDFQSIINLVGDQVRDITKAYSVFIALYNKETGLVSWPYWVNDNERIESGSEPLRKNITRRILEASEPLSLGTEDEILAHDAIAPEGYTVGKSFLGVPFEIGDTMLGALSIHDLDKEHAFTETDARLLQTLANAMSIALENARLFDEI